ncbi:23S rRNA pseudouridine1911/1915/1917 synthase [Tangfeifania diversioriginum]|uniref:Pseudouridine synthase n=1 Tax=Tangfeifania diversioriginum TaxID=1168035 RepID=A0A1M6I9R3_9BACT|nr:RluA family pseudouridine synthase [Tangfeifania diversioriginum]SHJ31177.1 23S rRNA pseudouridine1911/1915/1917 synthase [Tangfeifania diversioriginum]
MKQKSSNPRSGSKKPQAPGIEVKKQEELMKFLLANYPDKSRNKVKSLLKNRQVFVDDRAITQFNHLLKPGQIVTLGKNTPKPAARQVFGMTIVYEDKDLIVVNKKAGLLTIATDNEKRDTVYSILSDYVKEQDEKNKIFIVHRLDRETSGLMLFAKNSKMQGLLQESWKQTISERSYLAVIDGQMEKPEGTYRSYLFESKVFKVHSSQIPEKGKEAITHYSTLKSNDLYSLLKVTLETGRKNQIRVHLQDLNHPIIGDKKYGSTSNPIGRLGLHAWILAFKHPLTGEMVRFETSIPGSFLKLFSQQA